MTPKEAIAFRNLLKSVSAIDRDQSGLSVDQLLETCEKNQPSKFLDTGGSLFETFVMVYGSEYDSSFIRTGLQPRKRSVYKPKSSEIQKEIKRITKQYALRFDLHKLVF